MTNKIITVHGTFAAQTSPRGYHWWQHGSEFQTRLLSYLNDDDSEIEWIPFQWDGQNSEKSRSKAAKDLKSQIEKIKEKSAGKIVIIAHSHGEGVAHEALFGNVFSKKVRNVDLITVGTPFFNNVADNIGTIISTWSIYLFIIFAFLLLSVHIGMNFFYWNLLGIALLIIWSAIFIFAMQVVSSIIYDPRHVTRKRYKNKLKIALIFGKSYLNWFLLIIHRMNPIGIERILKYPKIFSRNDEAINLLSLAPRQDVKIVSKELLRMPICILFAFFITLFLYNTNSYAIAEFFDRNRNLFAELFAATSMDLVGTFVNSLDKFPLSLIGIALFSYALALITYNILIGDIATYLTNKIFKYGLLTKLYGRDTRKQIGWVSNNPAGASSESKKWKALPRYFDKKYEEKIDQQAVDSIQFTRLLLGMAAISGSKNLGNEMFSSLAMSKVIHTSYFEIDEFIEFISWIIICKFGFNCSNEFSDNIKIEKYRKIYADISPVAPISTDSLLLRYLRMRRSR